MKKVIRIPDSSKRGINKHASRESARFSRIDPRSEQTTRFPSAHLWSFAKWIKFTPVDILNIVSFSFLALCSLFVLRKNPGVLNSLIGHISLLTAVVVVAILDNMMKNLLVKFIHCWLPAFFLAFVFNSLSQIIPYMNPGMFDHTLIQIDRAIFGTDVTVWFERLLNPFLSELMILLYMVYFLLPLTLMAILYFKRDYRHYERVVFTLLLGFYTCYVGYFFMPATGPRFNIEHMLQIKYMFVGQFFYDLLDRLEKIKFDIFPSAHTALALLILYCSYRFVRKLYPFLIPIVIGIIFSTIYLRYHYAIDVIAGFLAAGLVIIVSNWVYHTSRRTAGNNRE